MGFQFFRGFGDEGLDNFITVLEGLLKVTLDMDCTTRVVVGPHGISVSAWRTEEWRRDPATKPQSVFTIPKEEMDLEDLGKVANFIPDICAKVIKDLELDLHTVARSRVFINKVCQDYMVRLDQELEKEMR